MAPEKSYHFDKFLICNSIKLQPKLNRWAVPLCDAIHSFIYSLIQFAATKRRKKRKEEGVSKA